MELLRLVGFSLGVVFLIIFVSDQNKTYGGLIRVLGAVALLLFIVPQLNSVFQIILDLADKIKLSDTYLMIVLKIIGVAYLAEFGYQLCKDAGEEAIGSKLQLAGKIMILVLAAPIAMALIELITQLI
ncbi:MAG: stage III sporulation protein AD [Cellulosilyticaceae bacterium]